jgi:hypothetical protein
MAASAATKGMAVATINSRPPGADALEDQVAWDLEQAVTEEEQATADAVGCRADLEIALQ